MKNIKQNKPKTWKYLHFFMSAETNMFRRFIESENITRNHWSIDDVAKVDQIQE